MDYYLMLLNDKKFLAYTLEDEARDEKNKR